PDHFYLTRSLHHLDLHSFPTRRSSDLVTDGNADPLPGASILIKGTTIGTTTDADGRYTIDVPSGDAVLVFSFIGYVSQEIPVGQRSVIDISLTPDVQSLEEVVVVGYGEMKKSDLTGAVSSVSNADIIRTAPIQAAGAMQGQVAGVNIVKTNGKPGDDFDIDIRGINSIGK